MREAADRRLMGRKWGQRAGLGAARLELDCEGREHRNVDARRQLTAIVASALKDTLPAWRIEPPAPADELLGYYRKAEAATGVGWNYLAAINLVETGLGRIVGVSHAGAQGPRQFLPSTFAVYGDGARSSR